MSSTVTTSAISNKSPFEITKGGSPTRILNPLNSRSLVPSYAQSTLVTSNIVQVVVPVVVPSIAMGSQLSISGSAVMYTFKGLKIAPSDTGQFTISNVTINNPPTALIIGHISTSITGTAPTQAQPQPGNLLAPGTIYPSLSLTVSAPVYAVTAYAGGTINISASVALHGTITNS